MELPMHYCMPATGKAGKAFQGAAASPESPLLAFSLSRWREDGLLKHKQVTLWNTPYTIPL